MVTLQKGNHRRTFWVFDDGSAREILPDGLGLLIWDFDEFARLLRFRDGYKSVK